MASRGSSNPAILIAMTIVSVVALALFFTTVMFYGAKNKAEKELADAQQASRDFLGGQTDLPWAIRWQEQATQARQPVIAYMNSAWEEMAKRTTGDSQQTPEEFQTLLGSISGADVSPLTQVIEQQSRQIASLEQQVSDANDASAAAAADLQSQVERVAQVQADSASTVTALNEEIGKYKAEFDSFRTLVDKTIADNNQRVEEIRREAADRGASDQARIAELEEETLRQQGQLTSLRESQVTSALLPTNEFALVDGRVVGADPTQNVVFIDLGRADRVVLGMSFEVYSNAGVIRPDSQGVYPPGKATIEIIRINEGSSVARIVRQSRGNPIVNGDVLANAVYDPEKVYHFVVYGNFDTNGDGAPRPEEQTAIKGIISQWGGIIDDDLSGRTDFLVLGDRPVLPPQPLPNVPIAIIQEYIRKSRVVDEYDRLFHAAVQASIPILNQNRLYTLTGLHGVR